MFGADVSGFWMMACIPRNLQGIHAQHVEAEWLLNENVDAQKGSMEGRKGAWGGIGCQEDRQHKYGLKLCCERL